MSHSDREGVCSDLYSDLCSDLSRKEVTIGKAHKHWGEKGISEVRRLFTKNFSFFVKLEIEKLEIRNFFSLLVKALLLEIEVMLLEIEVMLLDAEAALLETEGLLLQTEA